MRALRGSSILLRRGVSSSARADATEPPHIDDAIARFRHVGGTSNLALGAVRWQPPVDTSSFLSSSSSSSPPAAWSRYGDVHGLRELRDALLARHGLPPVPDDDAGGGGGGVGVTVTAGANQAFVNVALACLDPEDRVVLCAPYYFSHLAALQLAGGHVEVAPFHQGTMQPDEAYVCRLLEEASAASSSSASPSQAPVKMVVLTTPNNPSGCVVEAWRIEALVEACRRHGAWLVVDEAYEHFTFDGAAHFDFDALQHQHQHQHHSLATLSPSSDGQSRHFHDARDVLVRLHTLSKSLGMAGWRCGYVLYPQRSLGRAMTKVQDAIPTHCSIASQRIALEALANAYDDYPEEEEEEEAKATPSHWVARQVSELEPCREVLWGAVEQTGAVRTDGAFYFLVPLPPAWRVFDSGDSSSSSSSGGRCRKAERAVMLEAAALKVLGERFKVVVTPGSAFGCTGFFRASYGSLPNDQLAVAAQRLNDGLAWLAQNNPPPGLL